MTLADTKKYQALNHHRIFHSPDKMALMSEMRNLTPKDAVIVEVGCYVGVTSNIFAEDNRTVYCVDRWNYETDCLDDKPAQFGGGREVFRIFCENCGPKLFKSIIPIRGFSDEIAKIFPFTVDMVYIDADHTYPAAKNDILNWGKKVKPGGLVCGDDYSLPSVLRSIGETLSEHWRWAGEQWGAKREWLKT